MMEVGPTPAATMIRFFLLSVGLLLTGPACAEVCDKVVGGWWRPGQGHFWPVTASIPPVWPMVEAAKLGAIAIILVVLLAIKIRRFAWAVGTLLGAGAAHSAIVGVFTRNRMDFTRTVYEGAVEEGCLDRSFLLTLDLGPPLWIVLAWSIASMGLFFVVQRATSTS